MSTIILIAGAHHGPWCFERVVPLLEASGHMVIAPDLPGMGEDKTPLELVDLDHWGRFVADLCKAQDEKVILLGHSRGGLVITQAAELAPEAIAGLIYLTAVLPADGQSFFEATYGDEPMPDLANALAMSDDGLSIHVPPETAAAMFYNFTPADEVARALSLLTSEPSLSLTARVSTTAERFGSVPRAYIECLRDIAMPIEIQRKMQAVLPCQKVVQIDGDHSPFYSNPQELASAINAISEDIQSLSAK